MIPHYIEDVDCSDPHYIEDIDFNNLTDNRKASKGYNPLLYKCLFFMVECDLWSTFGYNENTYENWLQRTNHNLTGHLLRTFILHHFGTLAHYEPY